MKYAYSITANTAAMISAAMNAANEVHAATLKNKHDKVLAAESAANKAFNDAGKARQTDLFVSVGTGENPLVDLCKIATYDIDTYALDKDNNLSFDTKEVVIDFAAAIAFYNKEGKTSVNVAWQGLTKTAVKYAAIYMAGLMKVDPAKYITRLHLSPEEVKEVINPFTGAPMVSISAIKSAMQAAVNTIYGMNDHGKPMYWVNSEDVWGLIAQIKFNPVNNCIVVPDMGGKTPYNMLFNTLRHIVAGEEYGVEVREARKNAGKKAQ